MTTSRPSTGRLRTPRMPTVTESELAGGLHAVALRRAGVPLVELRLVFPLSARQISQPAAPLVMSDSLFAGTDRHDREGLAIAV
jgi:zinc protease